MPGTQTRPNLKIQEGCGNRCAFCVIPQTRGASRSLPGAAVLKQVEGFVAAYDLASVPPAWRETVERVLRQRLTAHRHPEAVADALVSVPRSRPFEDWSELALIRVPTLVVGSRDEADPSRNDPGHGSARP